MSPIGFTFAIWMLWVALAPSLIAREWWMTAINVGVCMSYGYLIGFVIERVAKAVARWAELRVTMRKGLASTLIAVWDAILAIISVIVFVRSIYEQQETARLVDMQLNIPLQSTVGTLIGLLLFLALLALGRVIARLWHRLVDFGGRYISPVTATVVGTILVALIVSLVAGGAVGAAGQLVGRQAQINNEQTLPGRSQPTESERSGSAESLEAWDGLGAQGQAVVSDGPRPDDITAATGQPAIMPIRVYAGLVNHHDDLQQTAEAVVAELKRTHAFDRSVLAVMTGAGKGWIQEWNVASLEYLTNGDCATASMQYSYTLSPFTYMASPEKAEIAGTMLFNLVYAEYLKIPEDQRPRLVVGGESLGSYGGQAAFSSAKDMQSKVDGAVWVGTPSFTPLRQELEQSRREGSPEIAPVIDNGKAIRFITAKNELTHDLYGGPYEEWGDTHIIYVQHPSDPIVWWSWDLIWHAPDWLLEPLGADVIPQMTWRSWATFWQLAAEMAIAQNAGPGHGHTYREELVGAWAAAIGQDYTRDFSAIEESLWENTLPR